MLYYIIKTAINKKHTYPKNLPVKSSHLEQKQSVDNTLQPTPTSTILSTHCCSLFMGYLINWPQLLNHVCHQFYQHPVGKPALETSKIAAKNLLLSNLTAVSAGNQNSGEPYPILPGLTLLNLHSYKNLMRRFRKSLIPQGIHVVTRHFDLPMWYRKTD